MERRTACFGSKKVSQGLTTTMHKGLYQLMFQTPEQGKLHSGVRIVGEGAVEAWGRSSRMFRRTPPTPEKIPAFQEWSHTFRRAFPRSDTA